MAEHIPRERGGVLKTNKTKRTEKSPDMSGQIMINGVNGNGARLEVYNAVGQKLFSGNLTGSNTPLNTKFAAGTYLVKLSSNGYSVTKKLIID